MIFNPDNYQPRLPLPATEKWKEGVWDMSVFLNEHLALHYFAPEGIDYQTPHSRDEFYFVIQGSGVIEIENVEFKFSPGSIIFVKAGQRHKFPGNLTGIKMWVIFFGPDQPTDD
jgi:mannose-6-phosphate isomerase-like protein (cupin superfamily)